MKHQIYLLLMVISLLLTSLVSAEINFNQEISPQDEATFDAILNPVMKIYNLLKYTATAVAVVVMLIAGIGWMFAGSNPGKRENSKNMITYVVIGLIVIWIAPLLVNFIVR